MVVKDTTSSHTRLHRDRQIKEVVHDPYQERYKPEGSSFCPTCSAIFKRGRWTWGNKTADAKQHTCPACKRIQDNFPAGYITLRGTFVDANRDMLIALIRHEETQARNARPLERIIEIRVGGGDVLVTTTDVHLPQRIGHALQSAYHGTLVIQRTPDDYQTRVTWERN